MTVSEYPDRDYQGSITRHPRADQGTRTMLLKSTCRIRTFLLYPGMYASVAITIAGRKRAASSDEA